CGRRGRWLSGVQWECTTATATTGTRALSLHDALPISHNAGRTWTQIATGGLRVTALEARGQRVFAIWARCTGTGAGFANTRWPRSEEHTSELQSLAYLVCRLLLEKKKQLPTHCRLFRL